MRPIGTLPNAKSAAAFCDFLVAQRIGNQFDREADGSFTVWIKEEEQLAAASAFLAEFRAAPDADKFRDAARGAEQARKEAAKDLLAYQRRVRTRKGLFPKLGGYGVGWLSYTLIVICIGVGVFTILGQKRDLVDRLLIDDGELSGFLPQVREGQVWRLLTPIFLHFGPLHLFFNLSWVYHLGCLIEARCGVRTLARLVLIVGLGSNLAQYVIHGPNFGGMSGVVYGLIGYAWIRGKLNPASGIGLDQRSLIFSLVWLVACFTGVLGAVANYAHLGGLVLGMALGALAAWQAQRNPE